jgi:hypothetical protein
VERFTAIGVEQDQALLRGQHARFNRLFDQMVAVEDELQARDAISAESYFRCTIIPTHRFG